MDHIELWDKAKALMREELANVSYTTWIEQPLKPVYVVDDKLALEVISDFNEKTIRARYLPMITEAVSQAAGREMTIELMSVKERIEWQERQKKEDAPAMQGFFKVILPDIMPGVFSGFIMALTMSIDDFVVSFFTTGSGVSNLSITIYTMAKRGISPKINALSTIIFACVFVLLIGLNLRDFRKDGRSQKKLDGMKIPY